MNRTALSLIFGALAFAGGTAQATDIYLCAGATTKTMPDGAVVTMWGFAQDDDANLANGCGTGVVQVPGPALNVAATDITPLNINVLNNLSENISIVIPGQDATTFTPQTFLDAQGRTRVMSFTHETAPATVGVYTWTAVAPGTYAYQSGTHPAKQVQMGLYGALTKNFVDATVGTAAQAYPGIEFEYDNDILVFYSEVDPALHAAVAAGTYGALGTMTSTIDYAPQYFLINGTDSPVADLNPAKVLAGTRTLLRFVNMGLKTHAPLLNGLYMNVIAEDGKAYRYARQQYSVVLEAGETVDAIVTPAAGGNYAVLDRMLNLTNHFSPSIVATAQNPGSTFGVLAVAADTDGDGVADTSDNCTLVANADQRDTNGDGFGNICDPDLNNDGMVNVGDYGLFRNALSSQSPDADFNGDGVVNTADYGILRGSIGKVPGPAGVLP